jgi:hypothetical protein
VEASALKNMVSWNTPTTRRGIWRRWPVWNGAGQLALPPEEALFCARRGWLTVDGIKARVLGVNDIDNLENMVTLTLQFGEGEWTRPHP